MVGVFSTEGKNLRQNGVGHSEQGQSAKQHPPVAGGFGKGETREAAQDHSGQDQAVALLQAIGPARDRLAVRNIGQGNSNKKSANGQRAHLKVIGQIKTQRRCHQCVDAAEQHDEQIDQQSSGTKQGGGGRHRAISVERAAAIVLKHLPTRQRQRVMAGRAIRYTGAPQISSAILFVHESFQIFAFLAHFSHRAHR